MAIPIRMSKTLVKKPDVLTPAAVFLRNYESEKDSAVWLDLWQEARLAQMQPNRRLVLEDFKREFSQKRWWQPNRMWFAEIDTAEGQRTTIGSITRGER